MYSYDKLREKSIAELYAMLADDSFSTSDNISNAFILDRITDVIKEKENIPKSQLEAETDASWERFLDKYDSELHIRQDDDTVKRKKVTKTSITDENPSIEQRQIMKRRKIRRTVTAVATAAAVVLACNAFTTFAYGVNILQAIVSFTDDVLRKDYVSQDSGDETISSETPVISSDYASLQETFNAVGIASPKAPGWLPEGFELVSIETIPLNDGYLISVIYNYGEKSLVISVTSFKNHPSNQGMIIEKDSDIVETFTFNDIEYYIFSNIDYTVSTWIDGMNDCMIEGDISTDEIKRIIISMYKLED
jgi:anti-sigma factor RsiW